MNNESSYIYQLQGKDLVDGTYKITKHKKRKATFDYSLDAIELNRIATQMNDTVFWTDGSAKKSKQYTNTIISVQFDYSLKKYRECNIGKIKCYTLGKIKKLEFLKFENGINLETIKKDKIEEKVIRAIKIGVFDFDKEKLDISLYKIPKGFSYKLSEDGKKIIWDVDRSKLEIEMNTYYIREKLYKNGFKVNFGKDVQEFVRYKRSSGSSRVGKCLFVNKKYYEQLMKWSYMGLDIKEYTQEFINSLDEEDRKKYEVDLASIEAYVALTTSSIIGTIKIPPEAILVIDDYESKFITNAMATEIVKDEYGEDTLETKEKEVEVSNSIWDGQSLLDYSVFVENGYEDKGFLLLRNRLAKTACFNSNIQQFFYDNDITDVSQLNGFTKAKKISDIKLITTPSSIKYVKFGKLADYLDMVSSEWGVVKYDKPTYFFDGDLVQTHYQLLNTLQFSKEKMTEFLTPTFEYIKMLKDKPEVMRYHLNMKENDVKNMDSTNDFINYMLSINNNFSRTDLYVNFRGDIVESYINNLRKGHVLVKGNYSVLCGNPIEMLKHSCNIWDEISCMGIDDVYNTHFDFEEELVGSRSPHITISNIWRMKNKYNKEIDTYLNCSKQIIYVNAINNNLLERLAGSDYDSDSLLITNDKVIIELADKNYEKFPIATNKTTAKKAKRYNTPEQKTDLDVKTSINKIGEIVNLSQILNSILWDTMNNNQNYEIISKLYVDICQLSVMSGIEIDKAKKEFSIDNSKELSKIRDRWDEKDFVYFNTVSINKRTGKKASKREIENQKVIKIDKTITKSIEDFNKERKLIEYKIMNTNDEKIVERLIKKLEELNSYKQKEVKIRPNFFRVVGEGTCYCFKRYETSMDILQETITKMSKSFSATRRMGNNKPLSLSDLFNDAIFDSNLANRMQIPIIKNMCEESRNKVKTIWSDSFLDNTSKFTLVQDEKERLIDKIKGLDVKIESIKSIIKTIDKSKKAKKEYLKEDDLKKINENISIERYMLSVLFKAHKSKFIKLFESCKDDTIKVVKKDSYGSVDIYGIKHSQVKINKK